MLARNRMLCSARRVQRSLCGGARCRCRFAQDRGHYPEAVGAHDHTANGRDFTCRTALMTESATDRVGCCPAWGEPAWGELPSSLRDATFAEVNIRAGDHVTHVDLRAPATAAVHCGHESPPLKFFRTLRDCGALAPHNVPANLRTNQIERAKRAIHRSFVGLNDRYAADFLWDIPERLGSSSAMDLSDSEARFAYGGDSRATTMAAA